jgi:hypothetical protein
MNELLPQSEMNAFTFVTGTVREVEADLVSLEAAGGGVWRAFIAASCLLRPSAGDEVLVAPLNDGRAFILAVLNRFAREACLDFPHGVEIRAGQALKLNSATSLTMDAPQSSLIAAELTVQAGSIQAQAGFCALLARTIKIAGRKLDSCFEQFWGRFASSRRMVSGHDEVQAGSSRLASCGTVQVQADSIHHVAAKLARIDAQQTHIS